MSSSWCSLSRYSSIGFRERSRRVRAGEEAMNNPSNPDQAARTPAIVAPGGGGLALSRAYTVITIRVRGFVMAVHDDPGRCPAGSGFVGHLDRPRKRRVVRAGRARPRIE